MRHRLLFLVVGAALGFAAAWITTPGFAAAQAINAPIDKKAPKQIITPNQKQLLTLVGGDIISDTIWMLADSPYLVTPGWVAIQPGVILTVEAGVAVYFEGGALSVFGKLHAIGTPLEPITFTTASATPAPGQWQGILFDPGADDSSRLEYVTVEYAGGWLAGWSGWYGCRGAGIGLFEAAPLIQNTTIRYSGAAGLWASETNISLAQNAFISNNSSGLVMNNSSFELTGSLVHGNGIAGLEINQQGLVSATLQTNQFENNAGKAVYIQYTEGTGLPQVSGFGRNLGDICAAPGRER